MPPTLMVIRCSRVAQRGFQIIFRDKLRDGFGDRLGHVARLLRGEAGGHQSHRGAVISRLAVE